MADFNEPQLTSTYTSFLSTLKARDTDLAALFANDAVSVSNWPARAVRFNTNSNKFQRRNSANSGFEDLTSNHHFPAITIDGSGDLTVGGNMTLGGNFDGTGYITGNNINVTHVNPPQTGLYRPATHVLGISTNTALKWAIDSDGRLFNNGQATHQGNNNSDLQIYNNSGGRIDLLREDTTVANGDLLGRISAYTQENANDAFSACAHITLRSDAAHTTANHASRIEFSTTGGSGNSLTPRIVGCFDEFGFLGVGSEVGNNPAAPLHINAGSEVSDVAIFASEQVNNDCTIGIAGRLNNSFDNRIHTEGSNMSLRVGGNATPAIALDSSGVVSINKSNPLSFNTNNDHDAALQVAGTAGDASIVIGRGSVNSSPPTLEFNKYRTVTYSLGTALNANDVLGSITFSGADGTNITESHRIRTQIITPDFSGNAVSVATGKIPSQLQLRGMNNDGSTHTYMRIDHNGHIQYLPHSQPSGGGQNAFALDIRSNNANGTGNLIRFTDTDNSAVSGQLAGGFQFFTEDGGAQNNGLIGEINVDYESGTPHGNMNFKLSNDNNLTIIGSTNHVGINTSAPEHELDVNGDAQVQKLLVSSDTIQFVDALGTAALQVTGNNADESMINITKIGDNAGNFPSLVLTKNHNSSATGNTATPDDSVLGAIEFQGARGSDFGVGARIQARSAAAFSSDPNPIRTSNLLFQVANANSLSTFMVLHHGGALHLGDSNLETDYSSVNDARLVLVDASGADIVLHRRDGTTASGEDLGQVLCSDSDGGLPAAPSAKIQFIASQNHSATAKGTDIRLGMCANGSTSITNRFVFRDSGAFAVNGDTVGSSGDVLVSKGNNPPQYLPSGAKAWISFKGTDTVAIQQSYNIDTLTDEGIGHYRINYDTNMSNADYCILSTPSINPSGHGTHGVLYVNSRAGNTCTVKIISDTSSTNLIDKTFVSIATFDN
jgi:hypothetical protein